MIDFESDTWVKVRDFFYRLGNIKGMPYIDRGVKGALEELLYDKMVEIKLREAKKLIAEQEDALS